MLLYLFMFNFEGEIKGEIKSKQFLSRSFFFFFERVKNVGRCLKNQFLQSVFAKFVVLTTIHNYGFNK